LFLDPLLSEGSTHLTSTGVRDVFVSPLAMPLPLGETGTTLATRVRRMVLGQVVALARLCFSHERSVRS
jgi:hypothetical protein